MVLIHPDPAVMIRLSDQPPLTNPDRNPESSVPAPLGLRSRRGALCHRRSVAVHSGDLASATAIAQLLRDRLRSRLRKLAVCLLATRRISEATDLDAYCGKRLEDLHQVGDLFPASRDDPRRSLLECEMVEVEPAIFVRL